MRLGKGCTAQQGNTVCDAWISPRSGWDLGGAGLEMEHPSINDGDMGSCPETLIAQRSVSTFLILTVVQCPCNFS